MIAPCPAGRLWRSGREVLPPMCSRTQKHRRSRKEDRESYLYTGKGAISCRRSMEPHSTLRSAHPTCAVWFRSISRSLLIRLFYTLLKEWGNNSINFGELALATWKGSVMCMPDYSLPSSGSGGSSFTPPPSTYQQVIKNMRNLEERLLPLADLLEKTIFNKDPPKPNEPVSDVIFNYIDQRMKALGVTMNTDDKDKILRPIDYLRDVTWELKKISVIGLTGKIGFNLSYCTLLTVRVHDPNVVGYPTWQCAYGDVNMELWYRQATDGYTWGKWIKVHDVKRMLNEYPDLIEKLSHRQIIMSDSQPTDQEEGDFWIETILPSSGYFLVDLSNLLITTLNETEMQNYVLSDVDTNLQNTGPIEDYSLGSASGGSGV